jgi:hypothetical protein
MKRIAIFESISNYVEDLEDRVNTHLIQLDEYGDDVIDIKMAMVPDNECDLRWFGVMVVYDTRDEED